MHRKRQDDIFSVTCESDSSNPPADIVWAVNQEEIPSDLIITASNFGEHHGTKITSKVSLASKAGSVVTCSTLGYSGRRLQNSTILGNVQGEFTSSIVFV